MCSVDSLPEKAPIDLSFVHPFYFHYGFECGFKGAGIEGGRGTVFFGVTSEGEREKWTECLCLICGSLSR